MENPKFYFALVFIQVQNKIFKADEKLAIVIGTQALVLNSPKLEFHLFYLVAAKTWSNLTLLNHLFPNCT